VEDGNKTVWCIDRSTGEKKGSRSFTKSFQYTFTDGLFFYIGEATDGRQAIFYVPAGDLNAEPRMLDILNGHDCTIFADYAHLYCFGMMGDNSWAAGYYDIYDDYTPHDISLEYNSSSVFYCSYICYSSYIYATVMKSETEFEIVQISIYSGTQKTVATLNKMQALFFTAKSGFNQNTHQYNNLFYVTDYDGDGDNDLVGYDIVSGETWLECLDVFY